MQCPDCDAKLASGRAYAAHVRWNHPKPKEDSVAVVQQAPEDVIRPVQEQRETQVLIGHELNVIKQTLRDEIEIERLNYVKAWLQRRRLEQEFIPATEAEIGEQQPPAVSPQIPPETLEAIQKIAQDQEERGDGGSWAQLLPAILPLLQNLKPQGPSQGGKDLSIV